VVPLLAADLTNAAAYCRAGGTAGSGKGAGVALALISVALIGIFPPFAGRALGGEAGLDS